MLGIRIQVRVILTKIHRLNHFGNLKTTSLHPRIVTLQQHMDIHILRLPKREQAPQINCLSPFTKKSIPFTAAEVSANAPGPDTSPASEHERQGEGR